MKQPPLSHAKITLFFASSPSDAPASAETEVATLNAPEMTRGDIKQTPSSTTRQLREQIGEGVPDKEISGSVVTIVTAAPSCCSNCCVFRK